MALSTGTRLGPYEILSSVGAGGMGEVYRARDTRLDRTVAVKVLPSHMSASPEVRQRFEREARTISQLSHPHICALYDVGRDGETDYLVMELLEGETLQDRLSKGRLPLEQTLRYGVEIADALDRAHRQSIVHRDLKPGNVMLTKSGAKLLDFGLAKEMPRAAAAGDLTALPTRRDLTQEGTVIGTFQYMAPEQLEGKDSDARTDIFAFGVVLYEMATGRKAFERKSQASLITAIMKEDPAPISTIQPMTPPALDRLVKICIAKDPDERWQSAADLKREFRWIAEGSQPSRAVTARRTTRERLAWAVVAVFLAGMGLLVGTSLHRAMPNSGALRFSLMPPSKAAFEGAMAVSPDGRQLAFVTSEGSAGGDSLWVHSFASGTDRALSDTEGAALPFWSPDGKSLGFFAQGKLKRIDIAGGPPMTLTEAVEVRGGSWSRNGVILFAPNASGGLFRISASGGAATQVAAPDRSRQESGYRWPLFLPDGRHFLFVVVGGNADVSGVYAGSLDSRDVRRILPEISITAYAPPGYLLFRRQRALMAQAFDADRLELAGEPVPLVESVRADLTVTGLAMFTASLNGVLVYRGGETDTTQLVWYDRGGRRLSTMGSPGGYSEPALSPDPKRVAVSRRSGETGTIDVLIFDLSRDTTSRLTLVPSDNWSPVWSPDGRRIAFASWRAGNAELYEKAATGAGQETLLLREGEFTPTPDDWSPDGRILLYEQPAAKTGSDLWALPLFGDRKPMPYLRGEANESKARFSPDGRWVAYVSDEDGRREVFLQSFPVPGGKLQISNAGGDQPMWRRDGKELFYLSADRKLMSVQVKGGSNLEAEAPRPLFDVAVPSSESGRNHYVVTGDGERFLVNTLVEDAVRSPAAVVLNWTAELKN
jgi:eukaryotic-like serine/threonine-protein kinase